MKKLKILLVGVLLLPLFLMNVKAASVPYQWIVGGEKVNVDSPNQAKTATLEKDGKTVTLHLNNYNGGALKLECYGTGQTDMVFVIDLTGNNTITTDGTGIDFGNNKENSEVKYTGTGNLTINAAKPISYESYTTKVYIEPSSNKYGEATENTTKEEVAEETTKEEKEEEETTTTSEEPTVGSEGLDMNTIILIICCACVVICTITTLVFAAKLSKKKSEN